MKNGTVYRLFARINMHARTQYTVHVTGLDQRRRMGGATQATGLDQALLLIRPCGLHEKARSRRLYTGTRIGAAGCLSAFWCISVSRLVASATLPGCGEHEHRRHRSSDEHGPARSLGSLALALWRYKLPATRPPAPTTTLVEHDRRLARVSADPAPATPEAPTPSFSCPARQNGQCLSRGGPPSTPANRKRTRAQPPAAAAEPWGMGDSSGSH
jgi:hypothetical protein